MNNRISRRAFLGSAAALGTASLVLPSRSFAAADKRRLIVGTRPIEVNGKAASVFGITEANGSPGLILGPEERFDLWLDKRTDVHTTIHWHGKVPPPQQDGVSDTAYVPLLDAGQGRSFDFAPRSGTHWMHSHH